MWSNERVAGIEPACPAWKAGALPLSYTRELRLTTSRVVGDNVPPRSCATRLSVMYPAAAGRPTPHAERFGRERTAQSRNPPDAIMRDRRLRTFTYCARCGAKVYRPPSKLVRQAVTFCSRVCKNVHMWQTSPPKFATGESRYRQRAFEAHGARCQECGWDDIPDVLEAHHRDHDRTNNTPENLVVLCPTCHRVAHYRERSGPWTTGLATGRTGPFGGGPRDE